MIQNTSGNWGFWESLHEAFLNNFIIVIMLVRRTTIAIMMIIAIITTITTYSNHKNQKPISQKQAMSPSIEIEVDGKAPFEERGPEVVVEVAMSFQE